MSLHGQNHELDRLTELLADEAVLGLEAHEVEELEALLPPGSAKSRQQMMQTAALAQLAFLKQDSGAARPMPAALRERIAAQGRARLGGQQGRTVANLADERRRRTGPVTASATTRGDRVRPWHRSPAAGWYVAAALAVAFLVFRADDTGTPADTSPWDDRQTLLSSSDVINVPWLPPEAAGFEGVSGDVVWSSATQTGYLRLSGMPVNDPGQAQYQLWIVDPARDEHPVDGGVFDINEQGEVIIPIQATLPVTAPVAFAITREKPGGVVVSAGPLLVVAAVRS